MGATIKTVFPSGPEIKTTFTDGPVVRVIIGGMIINAINDAGSGANELWSAKQTNSIISRFIGNLTGEDTITHTTNDFSTLYGVSGPTTLFCNNFNVTGTVTRVVIKAPANEVIQFVKANLLTGFYSEIESITIPGTGGVVTHIFSTPVLLLANEAIGTIGRIHYDGGGVNPVGTWEMSSSTGLFTLIPSLEMALNVYFAISVKDKIEEYNGEISKINPLEISVDYVYNNITFQNEVIERKTINTFSNIVSALPISRLYANQFAIIGYVDRIELKAVANEVVQIVKIFTKEIKAYELIESVTIPGNGATVMHTFTSPVLLNDGEVIACIGRLYYRGDGLVVGVFEGGTGNTGPYTSTPSVEMAYNLYSIKNTKNKIEEITSNVELLNSAMNDLVKYTPNNAFSTLTGVSGASTPYCSNLKVTGTVTKVEIKAPANEVITFIKANLITGVYTVVGGLTIPSTGGTITHIFATPILLAENEAIGTIGRIYYSGSVVNPVGTWERSAITGLFNLTTSLEISINIYATKSVKEQIAEINTTILTLDKPAIEPQYISLFKDMFMANTSEWNKAGNYSHDAVNGGLSLLATGNTNYIQQAKYYHSDKRFMRATVELSATSILKIPVSWNGINAGEGASCFAIDFVNKKIIIYAVGDGTDTIFTASGYTSTELTSTVIPDAVIGTRAYKIELHKDGLTHRLILLDTLTGKHIEVSHTGWAAGRQNQHYGFYIDSGTFKIKSFEVFSLNRPDVVFAGDSITEGVYVYDRTRRYAEQFRTNNPTKKVVISARGGDTLGGIMLKFATEYNIYKPKTLSVLIGANGGNSLDGLNVLKDACDAIGCILILHKRTCQNSWDMHIAGNDIIDAVGVNGARFDVATAKENFPLVDGTHPANRYNTAFYDDDGLHPTPAGNDEMYNRLLIDTPELFR